MVLLAAAVCTKSGKALISRQFVEMIRSRIEGLLAAFPKLMSTGKQHTFVETESVRYVYQPLDKLYVLLITTKASNILEDLETLRLFSRVIPEYCRTLEESDILENAYNLIFAFDEIVALGYRESVNLAQIRTFVEMDSHEEKVYQAVRQTQEREAKQKMREKAKELQRQRYEAQKRGAKSPGFGGSGGFGSGSGYTPTPSIGDSASTMHEAPKIPAYSAPVKSTNASKAMKLGGKSRDVDTFVDQLKSEGVAVTSNKPVKSTASAKMSTPIQNMEVVHLRIEEKMQLTAGRDGGLQSMEVHGLITLRIGSEEFGRIKLQLENSDTRGIQLQTHPQVDKEMFKQSCVVGLKNSAKSFPLNTEVGVLKWRYQTQEDSNIPLSINCWPSENGQGGCDVNIEYQLEEADMELNDVVITIPLMPGGGAPVVSDCDGDYVHEPRKHALLWQLPVIDTSNRSGAMEFSVSGNPDDFFPVTVSFRSNKSYANLRVVDVTFVDDDSPVKHSLETALFTEKYEIV